MKKIVLFALILLIGNMASAQIFSWGIKGGINSSKVSFDDFSVEGTPTVTIKPEYYDEVIYDLTNGNGTLNLDYYDVSTPKVAFTPSSYDVGYHFGAFFRIKLLAVYLQPELIFTQTNTEINIQEDINVDEIVNSAGSIKYSNFDVPVLVGVKLGPARLFAGPVATFRLGTTTENTASDDAQEMLTDFSAITNIATFGGQAGVGVDILKKLTIDVKYEFPLSKLGESVTVAGETFKTDQRQSQFIASIGWMF